MEEKIKTVAPYSLNDADIREAIRKHIIDKFGAKAACQIGAIEFQFQYLDADNEPESISASVTVDLETISKP